MPPTRKSITRMSRGKGGIIARPAAADNCVKAQPIILRAQPESDLFCVQGSPVVKGTFRISLFQLHRSATARPLAQLSPLACIIC